MQQRPKYKYEATGIVGVGTPGVSARSAEYVAYTEPHAVDFARKDGLTRVVCIGRADPHSEVGRVGQLVEA